MNKRTTRQFLALGISALLAATPMIASASSKGGEPRGVSGTLSCGGNHFDRNRVNGFNDEAHRTVYTIRNVNASLPIRINRLTVYDAVGNVIADFDGTTLPLSRNEVIGNGDNSIEPFQSVQYRTQELVGAPLGRRARPIQTRIEWAADDNAILPIAVAVRTSRRQSTTSLGGFPPIDGGGSSTTVKVREERARHSGRCLNLEINKARDHDDDDEDHDDDHKKKRNKKHDDD